MRTRVPAILIAAGVCALPACGHAVWQTFGPASGLAAPGVLSIGEDRSGNLWFGTFQGLASRYDGVGWATYRVACCYGMGGDFGVRAIIEDRSGSLWFATYGGGVGCYDGANWRTYTSSDGLASNRVMAILEDRSGNLWFGTAGAGVSRYNGVTWTTYSTSDGLASEYVGTILEDRSGNLWFGTAGAGVSRYNGVTWTTYSTSDGLASDYVSAILEDRSGNFWFGTAGGGVSRYDGVSWTTYTTADGLPSDDVETILEDRSGGLWFGTDGGGVGRYQGAVWRRYSIADGLAGNTVWALFEDHSGNLWFGTQQDGVSRYDGESWNTYTSNSGLSDFNVPAILEDRSGNLWFGTAGGGVSRYDRMSWRTYTTADGLAGNHVEAILEDRTGNFWFGTEGDGVSRYDGEGWRNYTTADGLADDRVWAILEDRAGNLWFATSGGVSRHNGQSWRTYTTADGLADNHVLAVLEDRTGSFWFGTYGGVSRYDGETWTVYLPGSHVLSMFEDHSGNLWVGVDEVGLKRYDGVGWSTYTTEDGLAGSQVLSIFEDGSGNHWFGTGDGVSRFDGVRWVTYTNSDGLSTNGVWAIEEDRQGSLWFGTMWGATRYDPDRVPPRTVFLNSPPSPSAARNLTAGWVAAFGETWAIEFSHRLDADSWSSWSPVGAWTGLQVADGVHVLEARSRDRAGNIDPNPAKAVFEVDATPPAPVLASPSFGQPVRGSTAIRGTTTDERFEEYRVEVRPAGSTSWSPPEASRLAASSTPIRDGVLALWDTTAFPDGDYDLRVAVSDSLRLVGSAQVSVIVDNHPPDAGVTTPAKIAAATGGDIYTTNSEVHLYFPPHAFREDVLVTITSNEADSVPQELASGALRVLAGYDISWPEGALAKQATMELSYAGVDSAPPAGALALYGSSAGVAWRRLGGRVDPEGRRISLTVTEPARYALFSERESALGERTLSALSLTPRAFSPTGGFADRQVAIGFSLGRPAPVSVRIYSRSGRLVREVVAGLAMNAGANLVHWDGRDGGGKLVEPGLYVVHVEAMGQTRIHTVAVAP